MVLSVKEWIQKNFKESAKLEQETIDVVADFALIWNLFEGVECSTRAGIQQFERYRLRNNLFHGLKTIDGLNNQRENLSHAIKVLQALNT